MGGGGARGEPRGARWEAGRGQGRVLETSGWNTVAARGRPGVDTRPRARGRGFERTCMTYQRAREPANLRRSREPRLPGLRCVARKMRPLRACAAER